MSDSKPIPRKSSFSRIITSQPHIPNYFKNRTSSSSIGSFEDNSDPTNSEENTTPTEKDIKGTIGFKDSKVDEVKDLKEESNSNNNGSLRVKSGINNPNFLKAKLMFERFSGTESDSEPSNSKAKTSPARVLKELSIKPNIRSSSLLDLKEMFENKAEEEVIEAKGLNLTPKNTPPGPGPLELRDNEADDEISSQSSGTPEFSPSSKRKPSITLSSMLTHQPTNSDIDSPTIRPPPSNNSLTLPGIRISSKPTRTSWLNPKPLDPSLSTVLEAFSFDNIDETNSNIQNQLGYFQNLIGLSSTDSSPQLDARSMASTDQSVESLSLNAADTLDQNNRNHMTIPMGTRNNERRESNRRSQHSEPTLSTYRHLHTPSQSSGFSLPLTPTEPILIRDSSGQPVPSPPPKSALRSMKSFRQGTSPTSPLHPSLHTNKLAILTRKFSDPGTRQRSNHLISLATNLNYHNRNYSLDRTRSDNPANPPKAETDLMIPQRLHSLDHLTSQSPENGAKDKIGPIIQELIATEKSYIKDLNLINEIYVSMATENPDHFSPKDIKLIFNNIEDIVLCSQLVLSHFIAASKPGQTPMIGKVFIEQHESLKEIYSLYFKHHEVSTTHLQLVTQKGSEVVKLLGECDAKLKDQSNAWDLNSLLIKPIQRFLKYPLLLKELLQKTSESSPDHSNLDRAVTIIQTTADQFNDYKKRKEIIDQMLHTKPKKSDLDIRTNLNKTLLKGAKQLRKIAGIKLKSSDRDDGVYEGLATRFFEVECKVREVWGDIQAWTVGMEEYFSTKAQYANTFLQVYQNETIKQQSVLMDGSAMSLYVEEYSAMCYRLADEVGQYLDKEVNSVMYEQVKALTRMFDKPTLIMKKRDKKVLDYDKLVEKGGNNNIKAAHPDSAQALQVIHQELIDTLPKFLSLTNELVLLLLSRFTAIQNHVYYLERTNLEILLELVNRGSSVGDVVREYEKAVLRVGVNDMFTKAALAIVGADLNEFKGKARLSKSLSSDQLDRLSLILPTPPDRSVPKIEVSRHSKNFSVSSITSLAHINSNRRHALPSTFYLDQSQTIGEIAKGQDPTSTLGGSAPIITLPLPTDISPTTASSLANLSFSPFAIPGLEIEGDLDHNASTVSAEVPRLSAIPMMTHNKSKSNPGPSLFNDSASRMSQVSFGTTVTNDSIASTPNYSAASPTSYLAIPNNHNRSQSSLSNSTTNSIAMATSTSQPIPAPIQAPVKSKKKRPVLFTCHAIFPYQSTTPTELGLTPGQILSVVKISKGTGSSWWYGYGQDGKKGWFPSGFCKVTESKESDSFSNM